MTKINASFIFCLIGFLSFNSKVNAQSNLTAEISQAITKFKFTDSEGSKDKGYSFNLSNAYHIGYKYTFDNGVFLQSNLGLRKAGATLVYDDANYQWDFNYFDFRLGGGYAYSFNDFDVFLAVSPYFSHLLTANQRVNNEDFNIIKSESIKRGDIGLFISPGAQMELSNSLTVYSQFDTMLGFKNIESATNGQKSTNLAFSLSLGLTLSLNKPSAPESF